jgi:hypothetical protein
MIDVKQTATHGLTNKIAKIIRVVTVPPIMLTSLLLLLWFAPAQPLISGASFFVLFLCLAAVPILAYPFQLILPSWRAQGRTLQRKLAFRFSMVGYLAAGIASFWLPPDVNGIAICHGYCFALIFLLLLQGVGKIHASGHACSLTGPIFYLAYFFGWQYLIIGVGLWTLVMWSSIRLGRHSKTDFCLGSLCAVLGALLGLVI